LPENEKSRNGRRPNRLIRCSSPYLRQHAHNPVDWYPWGDEAVARARAEDKPILLSIGYSACHWCHVMERESFESAEIARTMNEHFVNVKVDREERPDLDELYMRAVQLMTGAGGWPLTVFLTPGLVPFYGGTYFPPEERHGMPAFPAVLRAVCEAYERRRGELESSAEQVLEAIRQSSAPRAATGELVESSLEGVLRAFSGQFDLEHGGFGPGAKFPQAAALDFLLRLWSRTGDDRPILMLGLTLDRMAAGGIFDQVGGGFHRYTVDRAWRIPHFEKMLYDNAQLVGLYADAFLATGKQPCRETACRAAEYIVRELRSADDAFYAAQDADTQGVEGDQYVWTYRGMLDCLGEDEGKVVARYFGATEDGNWEGGKNILHVALSLHSLADLFGLDEAEARDLIGRGVGRLFESRQERVRPGRDEKVLTDWNALCVSGLTRLHRATADRAWLEAARRCVESVLGNVVKDGALMHSWRDGVAEVPGFLSDHALLAGALLDLYESTFDVAYVRRACELAEVMVRDYWDEEAGVFNEAGRRNEQLIAPLRRLNDQPLPSGCSAACHVLLRLGALAGERGYVEVAERTIRTLRGFIAESPFSMAHLLAAALRSWSEPREFVIVGVEDPRAETLRTVADGFYMPHVARAGAASGQAAELSAEIPLLKGKEAAGGRPTAYVCAGGACREPVQEAEDLRKQLEALLSKR
jgi:hypothetical protein